MLRFWEQTTRKIPHVFIDLLPCGQDTSIFIAIRLTLQIVDELSNFRTLCYMSISICVSLVLFFVTSVCDKLEDFLACTYIPLVALRVYVCGLGDILADGELVGSCRQTRQAKSGCKILHSFTLFFKRL